MKKLLLVAAVGLISAIIGAGAAVAAVGDGGRVPNPPAEAGATEGIVLAEAPTVRVAAFVNGGATVGSGSLVRSKGITSFSNPSTGVFCLRSNVAGFHPSRVIPVVSVDYSLSTNNQTDVQWRSSRIICPAGNLEFYAFDQATGTADNDASFTVVVP